MPPVRKTKVVCERGDHTPLFSRVLEEIPAPERPSTQLVPGASIDGSLPLLPICQCVSLTGGYSVAFVLDELLDEAPVT